ncbi:MAG: hypothetical protein Q8Q95_01525 [bacterium]|nr:hypothetical protein [bacterium]
MNNQGIALLITMLLLGTIMATALGVTILTTSQIGVTRLVDDSISAIFAADSGAEKMFYVCSGKISPDPSPASFTNLDMGNGAGYEVHIDDDGIAPYTDNCNDTKVKSTGSRGSVQRSFQASY